MKLTVYLFKDRVRDFRGLMYERYLEGDHGSSPKCAVKSILVERVDAQVTWEDRVWVRPCCSILLPFGPSCRSWSFHPSRVSIVLQLGLAASDAGSKAPTMHAACLSAYAGGDGSYRLGVSCSGLQAARCAAVGSG